MKHDKWQHCCVGDLGKIVTGKTPPTKIDSYYGGNTPFLTPSDDMSGKRVQTTGRTLTAEGVSSIKNMLLPKNAVCVSCIGTVGLVSMTAGPTVTNQQINSIIVDQKRFEPDFVYYLMSVLSKTLLYDSATSTAVPIINKSSFATYEVSVPPLETQRQIAAVLGALDDKIETNDRIIKNLQAQDQALCVDVMKRCEANGTLLRTTVHDIGCEIYSGGTPSTNNSSYWGGELPWLSSGETKQRFITCTEKTITQAGVENSSTRLAHKHDVVVASAGQGHTRGQVSFLLIDTYINQSVIAIHSTPLLAGFLFENLHGRYDELRTISNSNSIRGSLTTKMVANLPVLLPNQSELKRFSEFASATFKSIEVFSQQNKLLAGLRDTLLPRLMSGEIDVSKVQLDELVDQATAVTAEET